MKRGIKKRLKKETNMTNITTNVANIARAYFDEETTTSNNARRYTFNINTPDNNFLYLCR